MRYVRCCGLICAALLVFSPQSAAGSALLEFKVGKAEYQGKMVVRSRRYCWLMDRDGQLHVVDLQRVDDYRRVSPSFRSLTHGDLRARLMKEFGSDYEVATTRHYIVCAARRKANGYAQLFEKIYRSFYLHFKIRGFKVAAPEFPLVAVVFPDRTSFVENCKRDGVTASRGLLGYYMRTTNRVALFDPENATFSRLDATPNNLAVADAFLGESNARVPLSFDDPFGGIVAHGKFQGGLKDTIIHEATHQVAFNTGLHDRIGDSPQWIVEGLATVFEAPGIHDNTSSRSVKTRMNRERFVWFQNFAKNRRESKSLAQFVASDVMFRTATLDAYSQAWALTFFLIETRPRKYAAYLKAIAGRNRLANYSAKERVDDFKKVFGSKLALLDAEFLRFVARLK